MLGTAACEGLEVLFSAGDDVGAIVSIEVPNGNWGTGWAYWSSPWPQLRVVLPDSPCSQHKLLIALWRLVVKVLTILSSPKPKV